MTDVGDPFVGPVLKDGAILALNSRKAEDDTSGDILAQRIEEDIYFLSARSPIFWDGDFEEALALIERGVSDWAEKLTA